MTDTDSAAPLACVPGAIPADERAAHFALAAELFGAGVQERRRWRMDTRSASRRSGWTG
jgi:hypothetical protein